MVVVELGFHTEFGVFCLTFGSVCVQDILQWIGSGGRVADVRRLGSDAVLSTVPDDPNQGLAAGGRFAA